jgi:hypothetical protein
MTEKVHLAARSRTLFPHRMPVPEPGVPQLDRLPVQADPEAAPRADAVGDDDRRIVEAHALRQMWRPRRDLQGGAAGIGRDPRHRRACRY